MRIPIYELITPERLVVGQNSVYKIIETLERIFPHVGLADINAFIVTDKNVEKTGSVKTVVNLLEERGINTCIYNEISGVPTDNVIEKAFSAFLENRGSFIIAIGGGTVIDASKAIAVLTSNQPPVTQYGLPQIPRDPKVPIFATPTTAGSGSEVTPFSIVKNEKENRKVVIFSRGIMPKATFLDPTFTISLPQRVTAETGIDALTHAIEAYTSLYANPISNGFAVQAMKLIFKYLRKAYANGEDITARENMLVASALAGLAATQAGLGIVHALSHALTDFINITHGFSNAILLPHCMKFNLIAVEQKYAEIAQISGEIVENLSVRKRAELAIDVIEKLLNDLDLVFYLRRLGVTDDMITDIAKRALKDAEESPNPRKTTLRDIILIYKRAL
ncbi:MAG: iron-containing alcohol dehydrogenase [Candidatus Asgardarchaeia archaeon]